MMLSVCLHSFGAARELREEAAFVCVCQERRMAGVLDPVASEQCVICMCHVPVRLTICAKQVPGAVNIAAIACGAFHNLALVADGSVLSWGTNDYGQVSWLVDVLLSQSISQGSWFACEGSDRNSISV